MTPQPPPPAPSDRPLLLICARCRSAIDGAFVSVTHRSTDASFLLCVSCFERSGGQLPPATPPAPQPPEPPVRGTSSLAYALMCIGIIQVFLVLGVAAMRFRVVHLEQVIEELHPGALTSTEEDGG